MSNEETLRELTNEETLRELTADELSWVAGGTSLNSGATVTAEGVRDFELSGVLDDFKGWAKKANGA